MYRNQHWAVSDRRHAESKGKLRGSGDAGALHWGCQPAGLLLFPTQPLGCSGAAARVSPGEQLTTMGSPPFPKQKIDTSSLNGVCFTAEERREWNRRNQEEFSSSREQKLQAKRASAELSAKARSPHTAGQSLQGCCSKRHLTSGNPPCCLPPLTQASLFSHVLAQCPPIASASTGHRGSPSSPANTPNSSCACKPSRHRSHASFAPA